MLRKSNKSGFTLIELLIVVAIIAILAAIAIPNFLQAMVRAKVSRAQSEMQSLATALEAYEVDNNTYPLMRGEVSGMPFTLSRPEDKDGYNQSAIDGFRTIPVELSTPIAYISSLFTDPFNNPGIDATTLQSYKDGDPLDLDYCYSNIDEWVAYPGNGFDENDLEAYGDWRLCSIGPDNTGGSPIGYTPYNPTNGTISNGDILRTALYADGEKPGYSAP